jgi:hypothetical protein
LWLQQAADSFHHFKGRISNESSCSRGCYDHNRFLDFFSTGSSMCEKLHECEERLRKDGRFGSRVFRRHGELHAYWKPAYAEWPDV